MSRKRDSEIMFGSDSFLDVVANIVGILIILIVIAGLRVAQQGSVESAEDDAPPFSATVAETEPPPQAIADSSATPIAPPVPEPVIEIPAPEPPPPAEPPPELVKRVAELKSELEDLIAEQDRVNELLANANSAQSTLEAKLRDLQAKQQEKANQLTEAQTELEMRAEEVAELEEEIDVVRKQIQYTEAEARAKPKVNVKKVVHRLTPVARVVNGPEKHYRIDHGRIAEVPVDVLTGRLREQLHKRADWLIKVRTHQGEIGPVEGFTLHYLVERDSHTDELRYGGAGGIRLSVRQWRIEPAPGLKGETADEALQPDSRFLRSLQAADPNATLTFWVYPDSFGAYRRLQPAAHKLGFLVAARPLPEGVPIAGSPTGTKSAGQ